MRAWWAAPAAVWAGMLAALAVCLSLPYLTPPGSFFYPTLAMSAVLLMLLAFGLAGVRALSALDRLAAGAAFLFLALLLLLTYVDLSTRDAGGEQRRPAEGDSL